MCVDGLGWAGRQGCECYSWLAEGGRLAGWRVVVLMGGFAVWCVIYYSSHVTWIMCRLTWGGYLGLSPSCLRGLFFHFTVCLLRPHSLSRNTQPSFSFPCHPHPFSPILWHPITGPKSPLLLFLCIHLSIHPSTHPSIHPCSSLPPIPLSFLSPAFLCSVVTLSSLPRVLLQAYSVLDA